MLVPRRWVVERSIAWTVRFRRLACGNESMPETLADVHSLAVAILMLTHFITTMVERAEQSL